MARTQQADLESFAKHIEQMLKKGKNRTTIANLICRHLTGEDPKVSAVLLAKWVEWRYGKPTETHKHTGPDGGPVQIAWYDQLLELRRRKASGQDQRKD